MSVFINRKYMNALGSRLERFVNKGNDTWSFRCPHCGDSKKNKFKTRGYVYRQKDKFFYHCHNCSLSTTLRKFLKNIAPDLYQEYTLELFLDQKGVEDKEEKVDELLQQMKERNERLKNLTLADVSTPIIDLKEDHYARLYVQKRMIPESSWKYLSFAPDFKAVAEKLNKERAEKMPANEPRLIISTLDQEGKLTGVAARSFDPNSTQRYVHIKSSPSYTKMFGLDRLKNFTSTVYVFEGPIDSMFFENSLAACQSDLSFAVRYYSNIVLVHDNQPRNRDIVRNMRTCIENGFRVVIFPESPYKDINEMITEGNMSVFDIEQDLKRYTFEGARANLELARWKKI